MHWRVTFFVMMFAFSAGAADTCTDKDLNAESGTPLAKMEVQDQDGTGTCYAHVAANLVNYWQMKTGRAISETVDPLYAAYVNFRGSGALSTFGGSAFDAIEALRKYGNCEHDRFKGLFIEFDIAAGFSETQTLHYIEKLFDRIQAHPSEPLAVSIRKSFDQFVASEDCDQGAIAQLLKTKDLLKTNAADAINRLFKKCEPTDPMDDLPSPHSHSGFSQVDVALDQGQIAGIAISGKFIDHPSERKLKAQIEKLNKLDPQANGTEYDQVSARLSKMAGDAHAVTITGRKNFPDGCKYLIRNSWGADDLPPGALTSPPKITCACTHGGVYSPECKPGEVPIVGCWYKKEDLVANVLDSTSMVN